jgi:hypothetical protein
VKHILPLVGALVVGAGAAFALVAGGGGVEGTVVAKSATTGRYDYGCRAGGTMTGPVAVPAWAVCADPGCWRLVVRDNEGNTAEPCVDRAVYDRTRLGDFWHARTDR